MMPKMLIFIELVLLLILLWIHFQEQTEPNNQGLQIGKQGQDSYDDTFVLERNLVRAISVKSGILPPWLMQYNPTVIVLPRLQIRIDGENEHLLADEDDYIVYKNDMLFILSKEEFLNKYTAVKILGDANE